MLGKSVRTAKDLIRALRPPRRGYIILILIVLFASNFHGTENNLAHSIILDVPYYDQQTNYYCGPASVMMVLDYTEKLDGSQSLLSQELSTEIDHLTYTGLMEEPFIHRELTDIHDGRMTLNQLKKQINLGYAPILLIWFDDNHESGHYVVAVGYNDTGIFINDPWPTRWSHPEGRDSGAFVFLNNEKLLDLWSFRHNWALTVSYTPSEDHLYKVDVMLAGLPDGIKTRLSLNGNTLDVLEKGKSVSLVLLDEPHVLSVETVLYDSNGTRYYCTNNLQQVTESSTLQFSYSLLCR